MEKITERNELATELQRFAEIIAGWERANGVAVSQAWQNEAGWYCEYWETDNKGRRSATIGGHDGRMHHMFDDLIEAEKEAGIFLSHIFQPSPGELRVWAEIDGERRYLKLPAPVADPEIAPVAAEAVPA